jgi:hypothetical protein
MNKYLHVFLLAFYCVTAQATTQPERCFLVKLDQPVESHTESTTTDILSPQVNPDKVIEIFNAAVSRGELKLFEQQIGISALKPQRVEYIYQVGEQKPTVKVYSLLDKPMPLPAMPEIRIEGVTVILDARGHIIEAVVHCHH